MCASELAPQILSASSSTSTPKFVYYRDAHAGLLATLAELETQSISKQFLSKFLYERLRLKSPTMISAILEAQLPAEEMDRRRVLKLITRKRSSPVLKIKTSAKNANLLCECAGRVGRNIFPNTICARITDRFDFVPSLPHPLECNPNTVCSRGIG